MRGVRDKAFAEFLNRCRATVLAFEPELEEESRFVASAESVVLLYRILAALRSGYASPTDPESLAADAEVLFKQLYQLTHLPLFSNKYDKEIDPQNLLTGVRALCEAVGDGLPEMYFSTVPIGWFGRTYQALIGRAERKKAGVYFTPDYLIRYVVNSTVEELFGGPNGQRVLFETPQTVESVRVIDPAMGSGDFLIQAVETLAGRWLSSGSGVSTLQAGRTRAAKNCVFGMDLDPISVEIARTSVALLAGFKDGPFDSLVSNLRVGDTLLGCIDGVDDSNQGELWPMCFPDVYGDHRDPSGFDIVLGNPPYVASKNGELSAYAKLGEAGQSDSYLMFVKHVAESGLLRTGGLFSMVLPDPVLARGNARAVRDILFNRWTPVSLLHVTGAFRDAVVANAIPVCRNVKNSNKTFRAARISFLSDRFAFSSAPDDVFRRKSFEVDRAVVAVQPGREVLYLADSEFRQNVLCRIHGESCRLSDFIMPFVPLSEAGIERVFRGEEIGKAAAKANGSASGYPMLMGGQSIARYRINWEGTKIAETKKKLEWYIGLKIVIQKSAPRIVAALDEAGPDTGGYIVPQSVYCIKPGDIDPLYLLAVLNSGPVNDYVFRIFTGYKMLQPQLELEDIKRLPIRVIERQTPPGELETLLEEGRSVVLPAFKDGILMEANLVTFVEHRINRIPGQEDVLHDLLACMGQLMTALASENPSGEEDRKYHQTRLAAAQRAIDIVVARLYGIPLTYALRPF